MVTLAILVNAVVSLLELAGVGQHGNGVLVLGVFLAFLHITICHKSGTDFETTQMIHRRISNRRVVLLLAVTGPFVCGVAACHKSLPNNRESCSNTDYGHGVRCLGGAGAGGNNANVTSRTVSYMPAAGNAIIASAYTCGDAKCQDSPRTALTISDNVNDPELCFVPSPHSPFALTETSAGRQKLQEYIWICPVVPAGVRSFTVTCSAPGACSYITLTVTEWTGLATSAVFDVDGNGASSIMETTATLRTSSPTSNTNELIYTFLDNTADRTMHPKAPHRAALQFWPGNLNTAALIESPGPQSVTTTWEGKDDWYGVIAAVKSAASQHVQ
jgi:hypothetical protein